MKKWTASVGLLVLRVMAGLGIASHGYAKLFGEGQMQGLTGTMRADGFPVPAAFAWAAALSEFLGGGLVAMGLATRFAAFFVFASAGVHAFVFHRADPFAAKELALAYWASSLALMFTGPGSFSIDRLLGREGGSR